MAEGSASLPLPCTLSNSPPTDHSSRACRRLVTERANVQGCIKSQQILLRKQQEITARGCGDCSASGDSFSRYLLHHSIRNRAHGKSWRVNAAKCQAETGAAPANTADNPGRLFIFGFGYTSCALAIDLRNKNWSIAGTCRNSEARSTLENWGFHSLLFNSDNDGEELQGPGLEELQQATHWLVSIPPVGDFGKDPVLAVHGQDLIQAAGRCNVRWIGYLSSTGVYGDWQGEWVDEDTEPRGSLPKALERLAAERGWLNFGRDHGVAVHVFRLGGIYGPGRNAFSTILQNRTRPGLERERRRFTSRIHVADVCQVLTASMDNPSPGRIYNVVDDVPAPREEVFAYARDLLGVRTDEGVTREEANTVPFFSARCEEKRVSNKRIKEELGIRLLHPSYKSGLQEILKDSKRTQSCV
ncbi:hypothetical protein R1flu_021301 [Riccia fluitans]|uniref:NAD-dependent epimerase/dehydratase domain-containing protein n=1 Tax=Riccia fluitans TaxID=41844 RepID=A0ABD1ZP04_9MARC